MKSEFSGAVPDIPMTDINAVADCHCGSSFSLHQNFNNVGLKLDLKKAEKSLAEWFKDASGSY